MQRLRLLALLLFLAGAYVTTLVLWDPFPSSESRFDRGTNGIWLGHKWYTGHEVRSGEPVPPSELLQLKQNLDRHGIRDLFIHVGPTLSDGSIGDSSGDLFSELRTIFPEARLLAWVGARVENIQLQDLAFQEGLIASLEGLRAVGFDGVHFDFEPMVDYEPGYLSLLSEVRDAMGPNFMISQAT
ncbi:MAG: hypothetical protein ABGX04_01305, partial [Myxococcales bacterium]